MPVTEPSADQWTERLRDDGEVREVAIGELRTVLVRGLRKSLANRFDGYTTFPVDNRLESTMNRRNLLGSLAAMAAGTTLASTTMADGMSKHVALMKSCNDCATVCRAAAELCSRSSDYSKTLCESCESVCKLCAEKCEKHPDDKHMQECAKACRDCAAACRKMIESVGQQCRTKLVTEVCRRPAVASRQMHV